MESEKKDNPRSRGRNAQMEVLIETQLHRRGFHDAAIENAFRRFPRDWFIPREELDYAYDDSPLPIGWGQTISQPYIVAFMTELLKLQGDEKVLEIGAGCGYQSAILSVLCREVHAIEIVPELYAETRERLSRLGIRNVHLILGNGREGLETEAPFDRILCAAAAETVPEAWIQQLKPGGRMVLPLGGAGQDLVVLDSVLRDDGSTYLKKSTVLPVRFVPLV